MVLLHHILICGLEILLIIRMRRKRRVYLCKTGKPLASSWASLELLIGIELSFRPFPALLDQNGYQLLVTVG